MSTKNRPFKKGDQILWRGKIAKITNDVQIEGIPCDLRIECDDGEVLAVSHSELLSHQDRLTTAARPITSPSADEADSKSFAGASAIATQILPMS
jgi:hypothetical protein